LGTVAGFVSFYSALGNFVEPHSLSRDYSESIECLKLADSVAKAFCGIGTQILRAVGATIE
jgi:hypothetical protein